LDTPENMARKAKVEAARPLLKIKVGTDDDVARVEAVRRGAPKADLIVDANEGWMDNNVAANLQAMADLGVVMVEQPVPAGSDDILGQIDHAVPICADEACHTSEGLQALVGKYDMINIKIDKTGGLTGAADLLAKARELELGIMVGCMRGSSLAMAPAYMLAGSAKFVDLDGPLLLAADFEPAILYQGSVMYRPAPLLWG
jgi:L-alanine-DL-glutamate epimerase-like enolase superfamily enzyme